MGIPLFSGGFNGVIFNSTRDVCHDSLDSPPSGIFVPFFLKKVTSLQKPLKNSMPPETGVIWQLCGDVNSHRVVMPFQESFHPPRTPRISRIPVEIVTVPSGKTNWKDPPFCWVNQQFRLGHFPQLCQFTRAFYSWVNFHYISTKGPFSSSRTVSVETRPGNYEGRIPKRVSPRSAPAKFVGIMRCAGKGPWPAPPAKETSCLGAEDP